MWTQLAALPEGSVIIHGGCKGADMMADYIAKKLGFEVERFDAKWEEYGKAAGPIRNKQMLEEGKPDLVLAFHEAIHTSKGTHDMIRQAVKAGLPVMLTKMNEVVKYNWSGDEN